MTSPARAMRRTGARGELPEECNRRRRRATSRRLTRLIRGPRDWDPFLYLIDWRAAGGSAYPRTQDAPERRTRGGLEVRVEQATALEVADRALHARLRQPGLAG